MLFCPDARSPVKSSLIKEWDSLNIVAGLLLSAAVNLIGVISDVGSPNFRVARAASQSCMPCAARPAQDADALTGYVTLVLAVTSLSLSLTFGPSPSNASHVQPKLDRLSYDQCGITALEEKMWELELVVSTRASSNACPDMPPQQRAYLDRYTKRFTKLAWTLSLPAGLLLWVSVCLVW